MGHTCHLTLSSYDPYEVIQLPHFAKEKLKALKS